jgi:hypothetical protein
MTPQELGELFERTERRALAKEPAVSRLPGLTRRPWVAEAVLRRLQQPPTQPALRELAR